MPFISAGLLFANFCFQAISRGASPLEKSVTTDLTSALGPKPVAAWGERGTSGK
jgi:hypothetical protein